MKEQPRVDMVQHTLPGTDGVETTLILHRCTENNYSQRLVIARRRHGAQRFHHYPMLLTRAQLLELIDHLIDRVDTMADTIPEGQS